MEPSVEMAPDNFKALATLSVKSCKPSRAERDSARRFCHGVTYSITLKRPPTSHLTPQVGRPKPSFHPLDNCNYNYDKVAFQFGNR
jgi:hypothetical protein